MSLRNSAKPPSTRQAAFHKSATSVSLTFAILSGFGISHDSVKAGGSPSAHPAGTTARSMVPGRTPARGSLTGCRAGSIASRMWQMVDRACYCPIVYNSLQAFKVELGFKR